MFTGSAEELKAREALAQQKAQEIARLLGEIDALEVGQAAGQLMTPGGTIRRTGASWSVTTR